MVNEGADSSHAKDLLDSIPEFKSLFLEKTGDEIASNFIIGMPGDTWNDILTTFEFADKITNRDQVLDYSLFSIATPLPGTEMYETAKEMEVIPKDLKPEDFYGFGKGVSAIGAFGNLAG